jgi:hypothetical protein
MMKFKADSRLVFVKNIFILFSLPQKQTNGVYMSYTIDETLELIDSLEYSEQELIFDLLSKRMIENRRQQIKNNADETLQAVKNGFAQSGTIVDLFKALDRNV